MEDAVISPDGEIIPVAKRLDENGHELVDGMPLAAPVGFRKPETLAERIRRLTRISLSELAQAEGKETFEEADDFDVEDEIDPSAPYETFFDPVLGRDLSPHEFKEREHYYRDQMLKAQKEHFDMLDRMQVLQRRSGASTPHAKQNAAAPADAPAPKAE